VSGPRAVPGRDGGAVTHIPLNAGDLIGLLVTFSWVILTPEGRRQRLMDEARRLLRDRLGVEGEITIDVAFRAEVWRTHRHD
jgi:hypothetical protein